MAALRGSSEAPDDRADAVAEMLRAGIKPNKRTNALLCAAELQDRNLQVQHPLQSCSPVHK